MKKRVIPYILTVLSLSGSLCADMQSATVGIVNFSTCITDSKIGKQEQTSFESLKKQMTSLLEDTEKQLNEISGKFNDSEYMDGLSPEAEEELKNKFRTLSEEMNRYQNQYYQVLQQANMRVFQVVGNSVTNASEKVAQSKKLNLIANKEAFFYYSPDLDVTTLVVAEMDKKFDEDAKNQTQSSPATEEKK